MDVEGLFLQWKCSKFLDKFDVEVKVEVDVKLNLEVNVDGEFFKLMEKVEENGIGWVEMEDIKVELDFGDFYIVVFVSVESVVKVIEVNDIDDIIEEFKDIEMVEFVEIVERLVDVC